MRNPGKLQLPLIESDGDGLNDVEGIAIGSDALDASTDDDGLSDFEEDRAWGTSLLLPESDGDGLDDFAGAITFGTNPLVFNTADLAPRGSADGLIDVAGYLVLTRLVSGSIIPSAAELAFGELNDNGGLDAGDLAHVSRVVLGEIPFP